METPSLDGSTTAPETYRRRGLWFHEFHPGLVIESPARTITEADLVNFAGVSGDFMPLHTDAEACKKTPFRQRIAHGMLVQSVATGLGFRSGAFEGTLQALTGMTVRWVAPVFPGDTIRLVLRVVEVDPAPRRRTGSVRFEARVRNQDDKMVVDGEWETRMLREVARGAGDDERSDAGGSS